MPDTTTPPDPRCLAGLAVVWFDEDDELWRCQFCDEPIDADGDCPTSLAARESTS